MALVFDIETDGLLDKVSKLHCLVIYDDFLEELYSFSSSLNNLEAGLKMLEDYEGIIVGHNVIKYDVPVLKKLYPGWKPSGIVRDTMVLSQFLYGDLVDADFDKRKRSSKFASEFPVFLCGSHSLEAWGRRLKCFKGDFKGPWGSWTQEMQDYCEQDVEVTLKLWKHELDLLDEWGLPLTNADPKRDAAVLEHEVAEIIFRQEQRGFAFNSRKAIDLYAALVSKRTKIADELQLMFPPREVQTVFIPKVNNSTRGYKKGEPFIKRTVVSFNPASRQQVAQRLQELGWTPTEFTDGGQPCVDDSVLSTLPYPEAKLLAEFFLLEKRIGQLSTGKQAWLKSEINGRIHGRVRTNGAVTGRMTHSHPNMTQVPSGRAPYGHECRDLFEAGRGYVLVGCDADALELRNLAGYMARYDGGDYIRTVLEGKKEDGTDMHTINAKALGCDRDTAKTWFYGFIYGSGDEKSGLILGSSPGTVAVSVGKRAKARFMSTLPALGKLVEAAQSRVSAGYLTGLDGRRVRIRSGHAALNTLLQSAGAIIMKRALVIMDTTLQSMGMVPGDHYEFVANVHDEVQVEVRPDLADEVGRILCDSITKAGDFYEFRCPHKGNYVVGKTWAETH
mgnify:CR=1 FL=1